MLSFKKVKDLNNFNDKNIALRTTETLKTSTDFEIIMSVVRSQYHPEY